RIFPQQTPLRGTITVPGDKSVSHRAIMLGAIADGVSHVRRWLPAGDTKATLNAFRQLGVQIDVVENSPQDWDLTIHGRGLHGLQPPREPLNFVNAGTGIRLAAGLLAGQAFPTVLDGSEQLRQRPMGRIAEPLAEMGAQITTTHGRAPLTITPSPIHGGEMRLKVASAQVKSALLLAGLYAGEAVRLYQPGPARDHTERMLRAMGVEITAVDDPHTPGGQWITLAHVPEKLAPLDLTVPADPSSAAFPLVATAVVPHSQITIENVGLNDTRTGLFDLLQAMGAHITLSNERVTGGEPAADLTITFSELHATEAAGDVVVRAIDEFPIWAVAASQAAGASTVRDAAELRVKEVDRISRLAGELRKLGVPMDEAPDGFTVTGPLRLQGATVDSHDDHRLAMSLAVAGLVAQTPTDVLQAQCAADSFPGFVTVMQSLGAQLAWQDE
ncbi:MAG: 3-phosphoshikimate 1-carboxyvinyltransferase, partial [Anaerolineales bacterium]|nr:3-phosphoshikimate 1-carboxyvinyltransferase [Anaerolineales bacterium]